MTMRLLLLALLMAVAGHAELTVNLWAGATETPLIPYMTVGAAATGETIEIRFRLRNSGPEPVSVEKVTVDGGGFKDYGPPDMPLSIAPGYFFNIFEHFRADYAGTASAVLTVKYTPAGGTQRTISAVIKVTVTGDPVVESGTTTVANGSVIDFGPVERETTRTQTITLRNLSSTVATVSRIEVQGDAFRLATPFAGPVRIEVGQDFSFDIIFSPPADGPRQGTLVVDGRSYVLQGTGLAPSLPEPSLVLDGNTATSSRQLKLRVSLASAAKSSGSGSIEMQFTPATGLSDDPTVQFLPAGRMQTVTVRQGESIGRFGANDSVTFQTGTTAGQIVFTIRMAGFTSQATITVAPSIVMLDRVLATRESGRVVVQLVGYDNVRTADQLSFVFYDNGGRFLGNGAIRVSAGNEFHRYFQTAPAGGAFNLVATFPVSGDVKIISSVDVVVTNSAGDTGTNHVSF